MNARKAGSLVRKTLKENGITAVKVSAKTVGFDGSSMPVVTLCHPGHTGPIVYADGRYMVAGSPARDELLRAYDLAQRALEDERVIIEIGGCK